jgi:hypothetical protein
MPYTTIHGGDMNERIAELYQVAIQDTMNHHDENPKLKQKALDNFCATRFSELIVAECIETMYNTEQITVAQFVDTTLKEHFGVE